jgi:two-component system nitrogen regulation response regulator GlnG
VDCGAVPEALFESELFGHERGAFTGANQMVVGKIEETHTGTLFLDEIPNMPLASQAKLLRVLQEKTLYRLGGAKPIKVDTRMLTASGTDLETLCDRGSFRSDLYFRLNEYTIFIPPLRQRCEDIPYLAKRFMDIANIELSKFIRGFSPAAVEAMLAYRWPGNVRQLRSVVRRAVLLAEEVIDEEHLGLGAKASKVVVKEAPAEHSAPPGPGRSDLSLREIVRGSTVHVERTAIVHALHKTGGNKAKASRLLQVDYKTLHTKVKEYGIRIEEGVHAHD